MKTYFGNHLGICINNVDPENRGRVQIFVPHIMPALYEGWNELGEDIKLECVGNNLPNGLSSKVIEKLTQILPWAEAAMPVIGNSVAGTYNPETGNFNQTNTPEAAATTFDLNTAAGAFALNGDPSASGAIANNVKLTYYSPTQETNDSGTLAGLGNSNNRLQPGIVALSPNLQQQYGLKNGDVVSLTLNNGVKHFGYVGDTTSSRLTDRFDVYLPGGSDKQLASTPGSGSLGSLRLEAAAPRRLTGKELDTQGPALLAQVTGRSGQTGINLNNPATSPDASAAQPSNNPFYTSQEPYHLQKQPTQEAITATTVNTPTSVTAGGSARARRGSTITSKAGASFASGALDLTLPDGTTRTYQFNNGGFGAGAIPAGNYTVTNPRIRDTNGMVVEGVGYSFDLSDKYDPKAGRDRKLLRIHPDGGATGTQGCLGIVGGAALQKQFYQDMKLLVNSNDGKFNINVSDDLPESGAPGASTGGTPTLDAPSQLVKNPTETQATALDTTGMAQGMFGIPGPGAMLWVFFREGDPLFPVYFAASYGATEWQSAYKASSPPAYGPQENSSTAISNQTVFRPNNAGAITFTGAVDAEKDARAVRMAHANGGYVELHPYGSVHYSPNEHLEQVAGTNYSYCLNREEWTQGDSNKVVIGNQWVVVGNPSQANIETIEKLTEKVKQINAEMMKN